MAGLTNRVYVRHSDPGAPLRLGGLIWDIFNFERSNSVSSASGLRMKMPVMFTTDKKSYYGLSNVPSHPLKIHVWFRVRVVT